MKIKCGRMECITGIKKCYGCGSRSEPRETFEYIKTKHGERDMRYKRKYYHEDGVPLKDYTVLCGPEFDYPRKRDGRRDMRYKQKCYLKADGTPDLRYIHPHLRT